MSRAWPSDNQGRAGLLFSCFGCSRSFAPAHSVARWDTVASALRHADANEVSGGRLALHNQNPKSEAENQKRTH